ncbi:MAG TPA: hypothetical protein DEQ20_06555 [Desulfobulbaceae bacterium]|nr:hypothetical protein [Desulfobulbaceae bacterium]
MRFKGLRVCCLVTFLLVAGSFFQSEAQAKDEEYRKVFDNWTLACTEAKPVAGKCQIIQARDIKNEKGVSSRLLQLSVGRLEGGKLYLNLLLPLGLDLRSGVALKIGEGAQTNMPFTTCMANGCQALVAMSDLMITDFKKVKVATVGFRPWNAKQAAQFQIPLPGFAEALAVLP